MSDERTSFKEMCDRFDVTPRTLRYYEYIELLKPEKEGRSRFYGPREIARMTLILRGRRWGFALEDIRKWLMIYDQQGSRAQMQTLIEAADRQIEALSDERDQLAQAIDELQQTRNQVADSLARQG